MKKAIAITVTLGVLSVISICSDAAFLSLPNNGATSAYIACNTGSYPPADGCLVTQTGASAPDPTGSGSGHAMSIGHAKTRQIQVNNTYTGGVTKTIGSLQDWVWKNTAGTSCIYGIKITMNLSASADYQPATGNQFFVVNDVARGGFAGKNLTAAYSWTGSPAYPTYRMGRTFTAVTHTASSTSSSSLPPTGLGSFPSISNIQFADYEDNWVNFTVFLDAGQGVAASPWLFVKVDACPALGANGVPVDTPDAIRIRQEHGPFIEVSLPGFAPAGANTLPAHTSPY